MNNDSWYSVFDNSSMRIALIGALAILSLYLLAQTITVATDFGRSGVPATDTITVQGNGQASMPPDVARITFTVQNSAATVAAAQTKTTEQTNAALDFVKGQGIEDADVRTVYYNISPQYSYPNPCPYGGLCPDYGRTPTIIGYEVSQSVEVTVHDLVKVSDLLAGLGERNVQNLNGPAFGLDDSTAGYDAARADAIAKAKAQAKRLADELGVRLGKIVNFSESAGGYPYPVAYGMGGAMDSKVTSVPTVPAGENTYNASVSITYEIR